MEHMDTIDVALRRLTVQTHLMEYEKLRDELIRAQNGQYDSVRLVLGSVAVGFPLLLTQTSSIPALVLAIMFYAFAAVYSALAMYWAGESFQMLRVYRYIEERLEPELNRLLGCQSRRRVLQWESFLRRSTRDPVEQSLPVLAQVGTLLLLLVPGTGSWLAGRVLGQVALHQGSGVETPLRFQLSWLGPVSMLATVSYVLGIVATALNCTYWAYVDLASQKAEHREETETTETE